MPQEVTPSSQLIQEDAITETTTSTTDVLMKEIVAMAAGTYLVKFIVGSNNVSGNTGVGTVYVNGSPRGSPRSATSSAGTGFSEHIGGIKKGDLIQLYARTAGSGGPVANVETLSLWGSWGQTPPAVPAGKVTN